MGLFTWLLVGLLAAGLTWLFAPWTLWTRSRLDEGLQTNAGSGSADDTSGAVREISRGRFVRQEHKVAGTARLLELADGQHVLRLEDFCTSDGPDLHVWLSEKTAGGNWFKYGRGRRVRLGVLKATEGNHNYPVPASEDLVGLRSAVIWCRRFRVAFGSAPLSV